MPDTFLASESMKDTESDVGVSHVLFYREKWMGFVYHVYIYRDQEREK